MANVVLARPDRHNGLDYPMFDALNEALDELGGDPSLRAVVLSGEGRSFCAGLDFQSVLAEGRPIEDSFVRRDGEIANDFQRVAYGWQQLPVPVIAAVQGNCLGGGCQIALAADIRIAAPDLRLSVLEIKWGLIPDMGLTQSLPRLVGSDVAKELTFTGRIVDAEEALELGLVTRVSDGSARRGPAARGRDRRALTGCDPARQAAARAGLERAGRRGARARGGAAARAARLPEPARRRRGRDRRPDRRVRRPGLSGTGRGARPRAEVGRLAQPRL